METCINTVDSNGLMSVSSDERHYIAAIHKLHTDRPDEVTILHEPDENDGAIYALVPKRWVQIRPPRNVVMSDADKAAFVERMKSVRK